MKRILRDAPRVERWDLKEQNGKAQKDAGQEPALVKMKREAQARAYEEQALAEQSHALAAREAKVPPTEHPSP